MASETELPYDGELPSLQVGVSTDVRTISGITIRNWIASLTPAQRAALDVVLASEHEKLQAYSDATDDALEIQTNRLDTALRAAVQLWDALELERKRLETREAQWEYMCDYNRETIEKLSACRASERRLREAIAGILDTIEAGYRGISDFSRHSQRWFDALETARVALVESTQKDSPDGSADAAHGDTAGEGPSGPGLLTSAQPSGDSAAAGEARCGECGATRDEHYAPGSSFARCHGTGRKSVEAAGGGELGPRTSTCDWRLRRYRTSWSQRT
jgi:hypothetical protein